MLATSRHEAVTDILTGLPNRRRLMLDLERMLGGRRAQLSRACSSCST